MNDLETLIRDRAEWKRRALAAEVSRDKALEDLQINLDALYVRIEEVRILTRTQADLCGRIEDLEAEIARRGDELQDLRALRDEVLACAHDLECDCPCLGMCWEP
jgi:predicted  nucleic acid-binding Zn-ribbon protein